MAGLEITSKIETEENEIIGLKLNAEGQSLNKWKEQFLNKKINGIFEIISVDGYYSKSDFDLINLFLKTDNRGVLDLEIGDFITIQ